MYYISYALAFRIYDTVTCSRVVIEVAGCSGETTHSKSWIDILAAVNMS